MLNDEKKENGFLDALNNIDDNLVEEIAETPVEPEFISAAPKKSQFIRFAAPAAASLVIVAAMGIGALIVRGNIFSPLGAGTTVTESDPTSSTAKQSNTQTDSTAGTTPFQSTSEEESNLSTSEITTEITSDIIPELVLLDGNKAADDEIVKCSAEGDAYLYEVNTVFAFSPDKAATKLSEKGKWGDFTVTKADSAYFISRDGATQTMYQHLWLKGKISFEAKANYLFGDKNNLKIALEIPEELVQKLPSLNFRNVNDDVGCRTFTLDSDSELGKKITERLEAGEEVTVSVTKDEFELQYSYCGLIIDGVTIGFLDNVVNYEIR